MLNFEDILSKYPMRLQGFKENILKEYLQYKILDIIYSSKHAHKLFFSGGTSIRIVHQGIRFSENLDFDNKGLGKKDFESIAKEIEKRLSLDGYDVKCNNTFSGAYHCYIRFPGLLFEHNLTGHKQKRILIQLDTEAKNYQYSPEKFLINKFGIFRYINTVPIDLLLSQKILTCLTRKREKGRDFFDVVYLMSMTDPDYKYLNERIGISDKISMIETLKEKVKNVDLQRMAQEVEPFLFDSSQKNRISFFSQWLDTL